MTSSRTVGILAFEAMEVLDYAGPYEVFNVAAEITGGAFTVTSLGLTSGNIAARGGFTVVPDAPYNTAAVPDVLVVPGGDGTQALLEDSELLEWLRDASGTAQVLASVCTGSLVLAKAGLLEGRRATTHHMAFDALAKISPTTEVVQDERYVRADDIWTSGGISAGIDMSLALVESLIDSDVRETVVAVMEWGWHSS